MNDPEIEFYDLLQSNWDNTNTVLSSDPKFTTGWYEQGSTEPVVSVSTPEENEATGAASGYTSIKGDGTGPDSEVNGNILIDVWCNENQASQNPKAVVHSLRNEVLRVINANYEATQYRNIGHSSATKLVEDDQDPVMYRYQIEATYQYTESELIA
jgi:hypothetical protein